MYLVFPLLLWLVRRGGLPLLVGGAFAIAVTWRLFTVHFSGPLVTWQQSMLWHSSPFDFCWYFALGMAAAKLVAFPASTSASASRQAWVVGVGLASFVPAIYLARHPFALSPENFFWGLAFAGLLVGTRSLDSSIFKPRGWLHCLTWLGTCSYSVYLVHSPILILIQSLVSPHIAVVITLPIVLGAGYLFHLVFERPFMSKPGKPAPQTKREAEVAAAVNPAP